MNPSAKLLTDLLEWEADDPGGAVAFAHGWTEDQIDTLTLSRDYESADLYHTLLRLRRIEVDQRQRFIEILSDAALITERDAEVMEFDGDLALAPTWFAGIQSTEGEVCYRGLSILGGETGVGKSKLAVRAALLACSSPNTGVIYLCAEIDEPTTALYMQQCTGWSIADVVERFPNFRSIIVPAGCTYQRVVEAVLRQIPRGCTRLIVIADTINTLTVKCQQDGHDYFSLMKQFGIWMLESRIRSAGKIAWLIVSELNRDQQVQGLKLDKWSDFVLRFRRGDLKNQVYIDVLKGRYSGREELGTYHLNWQSCEMERA